MPHEQGQKSRTQIADSPVYWFSRYESAILKNDDDEARAARARLRRLGYAVDYRRDELAKGGA